MVDTGRGIVTIRVTPHIQAKAGFCGMARTVLAVPVCSSLNKEGRKILVLLTRPIFSNIFGWEKRVWCNSVACFILLNLQILNIVYWCRLTSKSL